MECDDDGVCRYDFLPLRWSEVDGVCLSTVGAARWSDVDGICRSDADAVRWSDVDVCSDIDAVCWSEVGVREAEGVCRSDVSAPTTAQLGALLGGLSLEGDFNTLCFFLYPCLLVSFLLARLSSFDTSLSRAKKK